MHKESVSIIIPTYCEEQSIAALREAISNSISSLQQYSFEIVFVDDGSRDRSWEVICEEVVQSQGFVRGIRLRRNFGKAAALAAGFARSHGDYLITMDADLQDDPAEIPALLATLQEGYDLVCSWKRDRQDTVPKRLLSLFFNASVTFATGVKLHDINSGLKAYRRDVVRSLKLYGHMHRFIPVLAHDLGYRIAEIPVNHFPRAHGQSKYGWERIPHGIMDLLTVMILSRYATRPGHLFGGIGFLVGVPSVLALLYLMLIWITGSGWIGGRPLLFFSLFGTIMAAQFILFGLLVEMVNSNLHTQRTRTIIWEEKSALETKQ